MDEIVTDDRLQKYLTLTEEALGRLKIAVSARGTLHAVARDMLRMAEDYCNDAKHFISEGRKVDAFACLNYAYGWIDAGARTGLFDVGDDYKKFTLGR